MAKIAFLLLALAAVAAAKPYGGAIVQNHAVSSSMVSPHYGGIGYGMLGYPGLHGGGVGHTIATQSVAHTVPHYGMGLMGIKGLGYGMGYPGYGYGLMG